MTTLELSCTSRSVSDSPHEYLTMQTNVVAVKFYVNTSLAVESAWLLSPWKQHLMDPVTLYA